MEELDRRLVEFSLRLIGALLIVAVGWLGLRFFIGPVRRWIEPGRLDASVAAVLTNGPVRNHSALPTRRVQWMLPLAPGDHVAAVKEAIRARLRADSRILAEPAPQLFVQEWAAEKRGLTVLAWTRTEDTVAVQ